MSIKLTEDHEGIRTPTETELRMWCVEQAARVASSEYQLLNTADEIRRFVIAEICGPAPIDIQLDLGSAKQEEAA